MKKNVIINGELKDLVTYCTAIYELEDKINLDLIREILDQSPIFVDKKFDIKVIGTLQKTSVARNSKLFVNDKFITLQIRYELSTVVDIGVSQKDEDWIRNDINRLMEHFELFLNSFVIENNPNSDSD
ncbi:MAG: hypothetical protein K9J16_15980 [Melioribacteraceae bacterium]|nr:hypothetical protein [Melioribacteraceae bacterium]MCF8356133.1 hypothetical protein [Melioribacteraceae bacterium]MCF8395481.1 hypothetical protein [Melioribacteraceae bacterium]MCF8420821.1 hypothetical protein [Melioribacteraceae bacterium]